MVQKYLARALARVGGEPAKGYDFLAPLLAEQELRRARQQYLTQVIEFDRNQFRLYWALGQPPECSLPQSSAVPTETPVLPTRTELEPR
jgi:hypothetical protein